MAIEVVLLAEMKLNLTVSLGSQYLLLERIVGQGVELHLLVTHLPSLPLIVMERVITINRSNVSYAHKLLLNVIV